MVIPEVVRVAGRNVKVINPYSFKEIVSNGQTCSASGEIRIAGYSQSGTRFCDDEVMITFLHELLHFITYAYCSGFEIPDPVIEGIAQGLFQVLRDNKISFNEED